MNEAELQEQLATLVQSIADDEGLRAWFVRLENLSAEHPQVFAGAKAALAEA